MSEIYLKGLSLEDFFNQIRGIVREEISNSNNEEQEKFLSPAEAVKVFNPIISKSTLYNWTTEGLIPCHYLGGKKFYRLTEIMESMKSLKKYKTTPETETEAFRNKVRKRAQRVSLDNVYVKKVLAKKLGLKQSEIPEEVIPQCRAILEIKRELNK